MRGHIRRIEFDDEEQEEEIDHATARHRGSKSALTAREYQAQEEATTQRITLELLETMEEEVKNLKKVVRWVKLVPLIREINTLTTTSIFITLGVPDFATSIFVVKSIHFGDTYYQGLDHIGLPRTTSTATKLTGSSD